MADFSPSISIFMVGFIAYAIVKHRLMDIQLVFVKSLVYSLLILTIASIYVLVILYLVDPIQKAFNINPNVTFVLTGFLIAFGFGPFKRLIEKITDRVFYKGKYNPSKLLADLGEITNSTIVLDSLTKQILKTLVKEMRLEKAAFLLKGQGQERIKEFGFDRSLLRQDFLKITSKKMIVTDELEEGSRKKELLRKLKIAVLVPLLMEEKLIGHLILGEKKSGDMYTLQDLNFLKVFSSQAAIALHNAELFRREQKKVLELNALNRLSSSLVKTLHLQSLLREVINQALLTTRAESGSIMLLDEESKTLSINTSQGISPEIVKKTKVKLGEGIAGYVAQTGKPLILSRSKKTPFKKELKRDEITSSLTVPLRTKEKTIGVLNINRKTKEEPFLEEDLNLLSSFAAQAATAIENARLYTQATTDGLTNLYNHPYFQLKLTEEVTQAKREAFPLSLLMIDIDHFKDLNDTYGHQKGDQVLKEIAKILKESISKKDLAARYGGEEFAIILSRTKIEEARDIAENLRKKVETYNFSQILGGETKVTISIGVSSLTQIFRTLEGKESLKEALMRKADEALYLAKQSGRNKVRTAFILKLASISNLSK